MFATYYDATHLDRLPRADRRPTAGTAEIRLRIRRLTRTGA